MEAHAAEQGLTLIDVVTETGSGAVREGEEVFSHEHRPRLIGLLDRRDFDVLLVARLDRLSRDLATPVYLERTLKSHGVTVVSATEKNGDGAYAAFVRNIMGSIAELERSLIRDRTAAGKAEARRQGRRSEGRQPYGYRSEKGILTIDPEPAPVVRRIFAEATEGRTPGKIAQRLTRDSVPSPRGAAWSPQGIRKMLTNETYAGRKGGHEGIISRRRFNQAQAALAARARS